MANKIYVGDVGSTLLVDAGTDISQANVCLLYIKKPNGSIITWTPTIYTYGGETRYAKYVIQEDDLDIPGTYKVQLYIEISTWKGRGETGVFTVYDVFS